MKVKDSSALTPDRARSGRSIKFDREQVQPRDVFEVSRIAGQHAQSMLYRLAGDPEILNAGPVAALAVPGKVGDQLAEQLRGAGVDRRLRTIRSRPMAFQLPKGSRSRSNWCMRSWRMVTMPSSPVAKRLQ